MRSQVYDALVRSPYRENKLHFSTTLRNDVTDLLTKMATARETSEASILSMLDSIVDLEFYMPVPEHREAWTGGRQLIVASQLLDDGSIPIAFDLAGREVTIPSAEEPPEIPTLVLVPVETDFSSTMRSPGQAVRPDAGEASQTPGYYLKYLDTEDDHEGWPRGTPEIEIHAWRKKNSTQFEDFSCSDQDQTQASGKYFDQNGLHWSGEVLVARSSDLDAPGVSADRHFLTVWEDDSEPCRDWYSPNGRPPKESANFWQKLNDFLNKLAGIQGGPPDSLKSYTRGAGTSLLGMVSANGDDMVGWLELPGGSSGCWTEASGEVQVELTNEDGYEAGYGKVDVTSDYVRTPICALEAAINGPSTIIINDYGSYSPTPYYTASVIGGTGTISYEWRDGGVLKSTSSSYTISPVVESTHYLTLKVTRGGEIDTAYKTVRIEESGGPEEASGHKGG